MTRVLELADRHNRLKVVALLLIAVAAVSALALASGGDGVPLSLYGV